MSDSFTTQGFLGSSAKLHSDLKLACILLSAILFNIGFILGWKKGSLPTVGFKRAP